MSGGSESARLGDERIAGTAGASTGGPDEAERSAMAQVAAKTMGIVERTGEPPVNG
jgi:hypothetical protein